MAPFLCQKPKGGMPIEATDHPIPSQPHWREETSENGRGDACKVCRLRMSVGHRICPISAGSDLHHPDRLDFVLADVLCGACGAVGGVRSGSHGRG